MEGGRAMWATWLCRELRTQLLPFLSVDTQTRWSTAPDCMDACVACHLSCQLLHVCAVLHHSFFSSPRNVSDTFRVWQPDLNSSACSGFQNCFILVGPFHLRYSCFSTLSGQSWSFFCFYLNFNFPKQSLVALIRLIPFFVDYHDTAYPTFMVLSRLVS